MILSYLKSIRILIKDVFPIICSIIIIKLTIIKLVKIDVILLFLKNVDMAKLKVAIAPPVIDFMIINANIKSL